MANLVKAHSKAWRWRDTLFPLYDQCEFLIKGVVATGAGAFHPGQTPPSSPPYLETFLTTTSSQTLQSQEFESSFLTDELSNEITSDLPPVSSLP